MATLSEERIAELVQPYVGGADVPEGIYEKLSDYLDLLVKWNGRTNLTAIRNPEEMVRRHYGESLFAGLQVRERVEEGATLLDFGSGAGFPGLPVQLLMPGLRVTLAESQGKKASFLREAVRTLGIKTEVWAGRVEAMPAGLFEVVTLRAVDNMGLAKAEARRRVRPGGWLVALTTEVASGVESVPLPGGGPGVVTMEQVGAAGE